MRSFHGLLGRLFLVALLLGSAASFVSAQPDGGFGPPPGGGPPPDGMDAGQQHGPNLDRELKKLTKLLTLTADQQTKVKAILTERNQQIGDFFKANAPKRDNGDAKSSDDAQPAPDEQFEKMRTALKAIRGTANGKIAALLTEAQAPKFDAYLKQQAKAEQEMGPGGPPPDGGGGPGGPPPGGGSPGGM